jgi:4-amino-4-deoxy-L-arabinose transferase-like glycosyltransferase
MAAATRGSRPRPDDEMSDAEDRATGTAETTSRNAAPAATIAAAIGLLLLFGTASIWSALRESATFDEVPHIGAGYSHLALHDYHLDPGGNPPLMKLLAAAPLLPLHPELPTGDPAWGQCLEGKFGLAFLYGHGDGREILLRARLPFVALGVLLGAAVFLWARELWGPRGGLLALALYALNPELLAHSHYANSDFGIAVFTVLFLWGLQRFVRRPTLASGAGCALAFALAAVTKLSFVLLVPLGIAVVASEAVALARREGPRVLLGRAGRLLQLVAAGMVATWVAIWAVHGFRAEASDTPFPACEINAVENLLRGAPRLRGLLVTLRDRELLPEPYLRAIAYRHFEETTAGFRHSFVAGRVRVGGVWYFFPLALAVKTPLPLLLLAGLGVALRRRPEETAADARRWSIVAPVALFFAIGIASGVSIGYRHLLPILPLLAVLAGRSALVLQGSRAGWAPALLLAWQAAGTAWVAPHFLSYFNELAGGPAHGYRLLVDSNTDWGQDLDELVRLCRRDKLPPVKLSYFGSASPDAAGLAYTGLPFVTSGWTPRRFDTTICAGDVIAVSVTNLHGVYFSDPDKYPVTLDLADARGEMGFVRFMTWLDAHYRPATRAGYSILVYRLTPEYRR